MTQARRWWEAPPGTQGTVRSFAVAVSFMALLLAGVGWFALQPRLETLQDFGRQSHALRRGILEEWEIACTRQCSSAPPIRARVTVQPDVHGPGTSTQIVWQKRRTPDPYTAQGPGVPLRCVANQPWWCERPGESVRELASLKRFRLGVAVLAGVATAVALVTLISLVGTHRIGHRA